MGSGMWDLGLIVLPFVCLIMALMLLFKMKKESKNKRKTSIILIIILMLPILNTIITGSGNLIKRFSYADIKNISYEIKQTDKFQFDIYFYDKEGYYYIAKKQNINLENENRVYLTKSDKIKQSGMTINLLTQKLSKVYMCDYKENEVIIWDSNNYNK